MIGTPPERMLGSPHLTNGLRASLRVRSPPLGVGRAAAEEV
jgi:hypothetical protein